MMVVMRQNDGVNTAIPSRTRIKFCGLTRVEDVQFAQALGVDAVGCIFAPRSPRRIDLAQALQLRAGLSRAQRRPQIVALVVDADASLLSALRNELRPDLIQFHGSESGEFCEGHGDAYLRAVPMRNMTHLDAWLADYPNASGFVFDSHAPGGSGGSGQIFDWNALPEDRSKVWLAGGLTADNVAHAVATVRPFAVDVSSGIESAPGIKCVEKMQAFVKEVRRADVAARSQ